MKVLAVNPKKSKVFNPITITVTVTLEKQEEVDELREILIEDNKNGLSAITDYNGDTDWNIPGEIAVEIAKQL